MSLPPQPPSRKPLRKDENGTSIAEYPMSSSQSNKGVDVNSFGPSEENPPSSLASPGQPWGRGYADIKLSLAPACSLTPSASSSSSSSSYVWSPDCPPAAT
ncbi:Hypothetical predicted protein [Marmota monax]|uniref:Uncharacterized protein n=1 Tax=Marmota monax TaxID=9995 RepID=A0A5E4BZW2_MARMO|nr:Hypothetical predicted protein [Marmota monax]